MTASKECETFTDWCVVGEVELCLTHNRPKALCDLASKDAELEGARLNAGIDGRTLAVQHAEIERLRADREEALNLLDEARYEGGALERELVKMRETWTVDVDVLLMARRALSSEPSAEGEKR